MCPTWLLSALLSSSYLAFIDLITYASHINMGEMHLQFHRSFFDPCFQALLENGLVTLAKIPVCAESLYYVTHPDNHIPYVVSHGTWTSYGITVMRGVW